MALMERVVKVETQLTSVKEDAGIIRSTLHNVNNEMQKFVAAEMRCADSLGQITSILKEWAPILQGVIRDTGTREGTSLTWKHILTILSVGAGWILALVTAIELLHRS